MKLIAIYNVWGDCLELLPGSIKQIREHVDYVLIIAQEISNAGELDRAVYPFCNDLIDAGLADRVISFTPTQGNSRRNETRKRQIGIEWAKENDFTHFLHLDSDEYYDSELFFNAKIAFEMNRMRGSYVDLWTYYKNPRWRVKHKENYFVPFIHKLNINTDCGQQYLRDYGVKVDPTRAVNSPRVSQLKGISMHHYSYVRRDIVKKLRNSSASNNINKSSVISEYNNAKPGVKLVELFNDDLIEVPNYFNINIDEKETRAGRFYSV